MKTNFINHILKVVSKSLLSVRIGKKAFVKIKILVVTLITIIGALIISTPLAWMVSTSLKGDHTTTDFPPKWIPVEPKTIIIDDKEYFLYEVTIKDQTLILAGVKLDPENSTFVDPKNPSIKYYAPARNSKKLYVVHFHWENYRRVWDFASAPFSLYLFNTLLYSTISTFAEVLSCSFIAFGFARLNAPGKNFLFFIMLGTLMIPPEIISIPSYVLFTRQIPDLILHFLKVKVVLADTWFPLILPKFFGDGFMIFFARQFYLGISKEYDDAARIDGCSYIQIWWRVIMPMSKPMLIAIGLISFQYHWAQDYMMPLIYLNSTEKLPLTVGLANFQGSYGGTPWNLMMAASVISTIPLILVFFILNRYFIQGVVVSGIKG